MYICGCFDILQMVTEICQNTGYVIFMFFTIVTETHTRGNQMCLTAKCINTKHGISQSDIY